MSSLKLKESTLSPETSIFHQIIEAGDYFFKALKKGQSLRITDLKGNQAVDTLFYNLEDFEDRYSAQDTIRKQANVYLGLGSILYSSKSLPMLEISADTCGRHDTLGGACSAESNSVRYPLEKRYMHSCRDSFIRALQEYKPGLSKRDLPNNINFFMNVPVSAEGGSSFADGISAAGKYVELIAKMDVLCLISNCPQLNNPCNDYNPTPVEVRIWE